MLPHLTPQSATQPANATPGCDRIERTAIGLTEDDRSESIVCLSISPVAHEMVAPVDPRSENAVPQPVTIREEWEQLLHQVWERLWVHCRHLARDSHRADDLFQQIWLRVLTHCKRPRFEAGDPFPYLATVAKNCWYTYLRRVRATVPLTAEYEPSVGSGNPTEKIEQAEKSEWLAERVRRLPLGEQVVFLMKFNNPEWTFDKVADALGIPVEAAKKRYYRALERLGAAAARIWR